MSNGTSGSNNAFKLVLVVILASLIVFTFFQQSSNGGIRGSVISPSSPSLQAQTPEPMETWCSPTSKKKCGVAHKPQQSSDSGDRKNIKIVAAEPIIPPAPDWMPAEPDQTLRSPSSPSAAPTPADSNTNSGNAGTQKDDSSETKKAVVVAAPPAQQQLAQPKSSCPTNRFVERYFTTDPVSLRMAARAWRASGNSDSRSAQNTKIGNQQNEILLPPYIRNRKKSSVNSLPGHTGSHIPDAFGEILESYTSIEENANKHYGAAQAVDMFESFCGWDGVKARFSKHPDCMDKINFIQQQQEEKEKDNGEKKSSSRDPSSSPDHPAFLQSIVDDDAALAKHAPKLMDIVIPTIRDLDFLEKWRDFIEPFHLILVQDGDPKKFVKIPDWADFELHNRNDIESALGANSWIISKKDASIRNFGFLISKKRYVYTLDDDCFPVDPVESSAMMMNNNNNNMKQSSSSSNAAGWCSTLNPKDLLKGPNPILQHLRNLIKPSSPYFFNTIYDGFREGSDFVRGFPYSMRDGVPTVVSHGLWLNVPDYDAPTQLVKPLERNRRHVDAVLTIPAGVLFPLCSMNVAFDRKLIGPAFMQGLMGVGQPWARYDDMFAGWASKAVADHLGYGTKSGAPYIFHNKASNPFTNLKKEYKGLWWQEVVIAFFNRVQLPENCTSPETSYRALALQIRAELTPLHPYFDRLATAMIAWVDSWELAAQGKVEFRPSRIAAAAPSSKHHQAVSSDNNNNQHDEERAPGATALPGCVTYKQRYAQCLRIKKLSPNVQRQYFRRVASMGRDSDDVTEVALLRLHKRKWSEDFWLHTCSFIIEAATEGTTPTAARDVVLHVVEGHESSVPFEFQPLVKTHSEVILKRLYSPRIYTGGYQRGDLATFMFLKMHPQYNFAWVIEHDMRYVGETGWGALFERSRRVARESKKMPDSIPFEYKSPSEKKSDDNNETPKKTAAQDVDAKRNSSDEDVATTAAVPSTTAATTTKNPLIDAVMKPISAFGLDDDDAHLIWFHPPFQNQGYYDESVASATTIDEQQAQKNQSTKNKKFQWHFTRRGYFSGSWRSRLENKKWVGAFAPAYGVSRTLLMTMDRDAMMMNNHANQEVALPVAAQFHQLKIFPFLNSGDEDNNNNTNHRNGYSGLNSQVYFSWYNRTESSALYTAWKDGVAIDSKKGGGSMVKYALFNGNDKSKFDGHDCLANFLMHPIKY